MLNQIIVAIDESNFDSFKKVVNSLDKTLCMIKIGSVSFNSIGIKAIKYAADIGFDIFLDLKFHDIPNTVQKSIEGLVSLPINMLTVHISGGKKMMYAAMEAASKTDIQIFGVTALTSLANEDTQKIYKRKTIEQVNVMLDLAEEVGIDGVVCSPHELKLLNNRPLLSITPGIRMTESKDDQVRVMKPKEAIKLGANYIVIGRAITSSNDIKSTLSKIHSDIFIS